MGTSLRQSSRTAYADQSVVLLGEQRNRLQCRCRLAEKLDEDAAAPCVLISQQCESASLLQQGQHAIKATLLGDQSVPRLLSEAGEPILQVGIIQLASDDAHLKSEQAE